MYKSFALPIKLTTAAPAFIFLTSAIGVYVRPVMCEKLYEIHVWGYDVGLPKFYVKDIRNGKRYPNYEWPEEFKNLDADFINEHSEFVEDLGYGPDYVKCYFVERNPIFGTLCIHGELTEAGISEECRKRQIRHETTGELYSVPIYHRPQKK